MSSFNMAYNSTQFKVHTRGCNKPQSCLTSYTLDEVRTGVLLTTIHDGKKQLIISNDQDAMSIVNLDNNNFMVMYHGLVRSAMLISEGVGITSCHVTSGLNSIGESFIREELSDIIGDSDSTLYAESIHHFPELKKIAYEGYVTLLEKGGYNDAGEHAVVAEIATYKKLLEA